jgi:hypothetical protein
MMALIITRVAESDFDALTVAQGMEDAGCEVFSITYESDRDLRYPWKVWGRFNPRKTNGNKIDTCIDARRFPRNEEPQP